MQTLHCIERDSMFICVSCVLVCFPRVFCPPPSRRQALPLNKKDLWIIARSCNQTIALSFVFP